jgi:hypothetical protein
MKSFSPPLPPSLSLQLPSFPRPPPRRWGQKCTSCWALRLFGSLALLPEILARGRACPFLAASANRRALNPASMHPSPRLTTASWRQTWPRRAGEQRRRRRRWGHYSVAVLLHQGPPTREHTHHARASLLCQPVWLLPAMPLASPWLLCRPCPRAYGGLCRQFL